MVQPGVSYIIELPQFASTDMVAQHSDVTLVTYEGLPQLDPDDQLLLPHLDGLGIKCSHAVWDDPSVAWRHAGLCVIRSTWDYHLKVPQFKQWLTEVSALTTLKNDADLVRWNLQKTYLRDLSAAGAAVVPTAWLGGHHTDLSLSDVIEEHGWRQIIIKPTVGLATFGVLKVDVDNIEDLQRARQHVRELLAGGPVMVQPFLKSVTEYGERALIFINGKFSHAVSKTAFQALLPAGQAGEQSATAQPDELAVAQNAIDSLPFSAPLYARVDLVRSDDGAPLVLELELVEPSLFLSFHQPAVLSLCDALVACLSEAKLINN